MRDDMRAATQKAAKMMDKIKPNWFRRILFKRLDLNQPCDCICGQTGLDWEELHDEFRRRYSDLGREYAPFADNATRDYWIAEIRARRKAEAAS